MRGCVVVIKALKGRNHHVEDNSLKGLKTVTCLDTGLCPALLIKGLHPLYGAFALLFKLAELTLRYIAYELLWIKVSLQKNREVACLALRMALCSCVVWWGLACRVSTFLITCGLNFAQHKLTIRFPCLTHRVLMVFRLNRACIGW